MSHRHAAPAHTVGNRDVENDSMFSEEQSFPALEEDKKESYDKDDKVSNFFAREAGLISVWRITIQRIMRSVKEICL